MSQTESLGDQFVWMSKAIQQVRKLHEPIELPISGLVCDNCSFDYPCPTIEALDGEQV